MNRTILKFILPLLILICFDAAAIDCEFISEIHKLLKVSPKTALNTHKFGNPDPFLSVADGIGPSRPGIGEGDEAGCVMSNYEFHMIWAGADAISCERQTEYAVKAHEYAEKYNKLLRKKLVSENTYKCTEDLLAIERGRRCAETGDERCTGLEDWDGAHSELTKFVWNLNSTSTIGYRPEKYGQFWVSIRDPLHRKEIEEKACGIFSKYGIKMNVVIHIELANFNPQIREWERENLNEVFCSY